jgi:hypothetical protein
MHGLFDLFDAGLYLKYLSLFREKTRRLAMMTCRFD